MRGCVALGVLVLSCALTAGGAFAATPANPPIAEAVTKQSDEAARLQRAIDDCDAGASVPLDPEATAPVVHLYQFYSLANDFHNNGERLARIVEACTAAVAGAPDRPLLELELLRTEFMAAILAADRDRSVPDLSPLADAVRPFAEGGSAEANYLMFAIYNRSAKVGDEVWAGGVSRDDALSGLVTAANAGHLEALRTLLGEYRFGPHFRRDPEKAAANAKTLAALPKQGPGEMSKYEKDAARFGDEQFATIVVSTDGFSPEDQARAFATVKGLFDKGAPDSVVPYTKAIRAGRGAPQDSVTARAVLEKAVAAGDDAALGSLADMLAKGEGGPVDGRRAVTLLASRKPDRLHSDAKAELAGLYLDNAFTGRRPRAAIDLLSATNEDIDSFIRAAGLLVDYHGKLIDSAGFVNTLRNATAVGEPGAATALASLKLSNYADFRDIDGARAVLAGLSGHGDADARVMLAELQYDVASSAMQPPRRYDDMNDDAIRQAVADGIANGQGSAFQLKAELFRVGAVFPQDDAAATKALIEAAGRGDVPAMIQLGKAYDDGLGIDKDPRERLRWWRAAAQRGSIDARQRLADAFVFDTFDKLMTLREGVTGPVGLYNDGAGEFDDSELLGGVLINARFSGVFSGGRISEAGNAAVSAAVMDAFRLAPAGLADEKLLPLMRTLPDDIRVGIEKKLQADGFYQGKANGYFGPDVRAALAAWVDATGPLPDEPDSAAAAPPSPAPGSDVSDDVVARLRGQAFAMAKEAKTDDDREHAIRIIDALARNGDLVSRWALMTTYHEGDNIRRLVKPDDMTRYALDLMVTRPAGAEKIEFEFIFDVTAMYQEGNAAAFGRALVDGVRDDVRLQDPLTLGGIMEQVTFAPGGCDAVAAAATAAGVSDLGDDGCSETARNALIAFAKSKGPAGVDADARQAAAAEIKKMAAGG